MSRLGNKEITVPAGVEVTFDKGFLKVKGPKGELIQNVKPGIDVINENSRITVKRASNSKNHKALHGLYWSLLNNMLVGVNEGFTRKLELNGVGYRAQAKDNLITFSIGFSHPVEFVLPKGVSCTVEDTTKITLTSHDKQLIGQTAALIRKIRPPEPYKKKGIKYAEEVIRTKAGKSSKK